MVNLNCLSRMKAGVLPPYSLLSFVLFVTKISKTKVNDSDPSLCELLSPLSCEIFWERVLAQTSAVQNNYDTKFILQQIIIAKGNFLKSARWYLKARAFSICRKCFILFWGYVIKRSFFCYIGSFLTVNFGG